MTSPTKIQASTLMHSSQLVEAPFNYAKYADMESELSNEALVDFLIHKCDQDREILEKRVSILY